MLPDSLVEKKNVKCTLKKLTKKFRTYKQTKTQINRILQYIKRLKSVLTKQSKRN
jgi:Asp-tRNA(Asn)/Glu-tRNA(Gln) amidotransferase C subunit